MSDAARSYRFHPLERRGVVLGLGAAQVGTLAAGAVVAFVAIQAGGGLVAAAAVLALAAALALVPVGGRSSVDWTPVAARWLINSVSPVKARAGCCAPPSGVRILAAPDAPGDGELGVVHDRRSGAWAAVMPLDGPPFSLLDTEDKQRQLAAWGAVLASTCRPSSPVYRIQWVQRAHPPDLDAVRAHLTQGRAAKAAPAALHGYADLLTSAETGAGGHEVLLVVAVHPKRAGRQLRSFGPGRGGVCGLLRRELRLVAGQLRRAGIEPSQPLDVAGVAAAIRRGYEPAAGARPRTGGQRSAWPMAWRDGWAAAHVDGRWHATSWVAEWPRVEVGPDFLAPLLLVGGARVVALTMVPVPPRLAVRDAESARTAELADEELRRRAGFLATARHRRRAEGVATREAELADGHGELRFSGYVAVSGATPEELDATAAGVEAVAQQCGLELRRLYGQQAEALTWTLPLGRGVA